MDSFSSYPLQMDFLATKKLNPAATFSRYSRVNGALVATSTPVLPLFHSVHGVLLTALVLPRPLLLLLLLTVCCAAYSTPTLSLHSPGHKRVSESPAPPSPQQGTECARRQGAGPRYGSTDAGTGASSTLHNTAWRQRWRLEEPFPGRSGKRKMECCLEVCRLGKCYALGTSYQCAGVLMCRYTGGLLLAGVAEAIKPQQK
ncbi:hypothetical protein NDU88_001665 [Pleurodeles waltl]|uniref:Uncharacterized protein n=1 Tax=Pleurodeles waltl TaxID=8319 RepID=A0AAV7KWU2_PLEWA|nr:hypothetical protein NDU88_001665 [Pleurodeles waltl]